MNRVFNEWPARVQWSGASGYPAVNVWADDDSAIITAELPGVKAEDLNLAVEDDTLTLGGSRHPDGAEEDVVYHRRERRHGDFGRSIRLPFRVDAGKVEAKVANGVLTVTLHRAEADKPKKITVTAG
jgi:HSP20 family protein